MCRRSILVLTLVLSCAAMGAGVLRADESVEALLRRRAEAFVAAMNAPGNEALEAFARDHLGSELSQEDRASRFAERMRSQFAAMGSIERHQIQILRDGAYLFVYCKHEKAGTWQNYQFRVLPEDGHRLSLVFVALASEPATPPSTPIQSEASRTWLTSRLASIETQQPFSGAILVRRKGEEVYSLFKGVADASISVPVTRTSRFGMASGSKMFTAVAILQLDQAGKLSLKDSLIKYLPDFPDKEFAKRATLHQLLTHTAGAGDYWDDAYEKAWDGITKTDQMLPFVLRHLGDTPAGEFSYSNSGFVLLGLVIEAVSGKSFYDYVQERIFAPAGMKSTGYPVRSAAAAGIAIPYEPEMQAGAVKPGGYVPARLNARGTSAGGASTTADDLVAFAAGLRNGVLLDKAHFDLMIAPHVPYGGKDSSYGYGTILEKSKGVLSFGHGGNAPGTQFEFKIYPEIDTVLLVMSNYNTIAPHEMASAIDHIIRNEAPPVPGEAPAAAPVPH